MEQVSTQEASRCKDPACGLSVRYRSISARASLRSDQHRVTDQPMLRPKNRGGFCAASVAIKGLRRARYSPPSPENLFSPTCELAHLEVLRVLLLRRGKWRRDTVIMESKTATFRVDDIQAAYNDAVLSGRTLLAKEIEQLWLGALADQAGKWSGQQRKSMLSRCHSDHFQTESTGGVPGIINLSRTGGSSCPTSASTEVAANLLSPAAKPNKKLPTLNRGPILTGAATLPLTTLGILASLG